MKVAAIGRWFLEILKLAEIEMSIFSGHFSPRCINLSSSQCWYTTTDILKAADWSLDSVFRRFYYHPFNDTFFGRSVLALGTPFYNRD